MFTSLGGKVARHGVTPQSMERGLLRPYFFDRRSGAFHEQNSARRTYGLGRPAADGRTLAPARRATAMSGMRILKYRGCPQGVFC
jgi:hypothetical protein